MKSQQPELLDDRSKEKMKRAKKFENRKKNKKGKDDYQSSSKRKEHKSMFKITAIAVTMLFICGIMFVAIPSAFSFEDYITGETAVQEEVIEEEVPATGGGELYYEEPKDEGETFGEQETVEQDEEQETEQMKYEEEQGETN